MQVLQGLAGAFRLSWPSEFKELLNWLTVFNFDFVSVVPFECVVPYNFLAALCVRTLVPLAIVGLAVSLGRQALRRGNETAGYVLFNGGILLTFLIYPNVTQTVFKFFQVKHFDGNFGMYMMADYSVEADGDAYRFMTPYAAVMVAVWPIGVPLMISILLWRSRAPLLEVRRREKILSRGAYDGNAWAAHVENQVQLGMTASKRDEEPIMVEGYLWALTEAYRGTVFYFEASHACALLHACT